jgi:hypothetical protein
LDESQDRDGVIALFMFAGTAGLATAQDTTSITHRKTRTFKSDSVKLGPDVGHSVLVTGVVSDATLYGLKEDTKSEAREHGINKSSTEHGHMTVTNLKMVSTSCDK